MSSFVAGSSGWRLLRVFGSWWPRIRAERTLVTRLQSCAFCGSKAAVMSKRMLGTCAQLRNTSIDKDILSELNLRPDAHRQDPRDRVPTTITKESPQLVSQLPIMHVKATMNNTIVTISDCNGRVLTWTSAGAVGFKGTRRGTTFAAQEAGHEAARRALKLGLKSFQVKVKGPGAGRQSSLKGMEMGGINVVTIQDVTPVPHNGCKPRKARRL